MIFWALLRPLKCMMFWLSRDASCLFADAPSNRIGNGFGLGRFPILLMPLCEDPVGSSTSGFVAPSCQIPIIPDWRPSCSLQCIIPIHHPDAIVVRKSKLPPARGKEGTLYGILQQKSLPRHSSGPTALQSRLPPPLDAEPPYFASQRRHWTAIPPPSAASNHPFPKDSTPD